MLESPQLVRSGNTYRPQFGDDSNLYVEFSLDAVLDDFKSAEQGHPVYNDVEIVTIITPGNNKSTFKDRSSELYRTRFPAQYAAFKSQNEQVHDGLPIVEWPVVTKGQALNLKALNIHTVEQLSTVPDQMLDMLGLGGRDLREKAKAYLSRAVDASEITKLISKMSTLEADNKALRDMLSQPSEKENPKKKGS